MCDCIGLASHSACVLLTDEVLVCLLTCLVPCLQVGPGFVVAQASDHKSEALAKT